MPEQPPGDSPSLTAWIDADGDEDQLHIRVEENGTVYDELDLDIQMLAANENYLETFERSALTLLTLRNRIIRAELEEPVEEESRAEPATGGD